MFSRRKTAPDASEVEAPPQASATIAIGDDTFMDATEGGITIVDFWAAWCGPCRSFGPIFQAVAAAHTGDVRFATCDIESNPQTAQMLQIRSIPTVIAFDRDGNEIGRSNGAVSRGDLEATVAQLSAR